MSLTLAPTETLRFHISLNVSDLNRSIAFYKILFNCEPAKCRPDYAKFETEDPPLVVSLEPSGRAGGGTLNHLGFRLPDARRLVAMQERLERAGIKSQREEGVECCYAKQTKFWVHDPDNTLWEMYTLDDDGLEHRGPGQTLDTMMSSTLPDNVPSDKTPTNPEAVVEHILGQPIPERFDAADGSVDEMRLRGSFNVPLSEADRTRLLTEAARMLRPGGRLLIRILSGEKAHPSPTLPGPGAAVKFVPAKDDVMGALATTSLTGLRLLKYDDPPCFVHDGITMRETHIEAFRPTT